MGVQARVEWSDIFYFVIGSSFIWFLDPCIEVELARAPNRWTKLVAIATQPGRIPWDTTPDRQVDVTSYLSLRAFIVAIFNEPVNAVRPDVQVVLRYGPVRSESDQSGKYWRTKIQPFMFTVYSSAGGFFISWKGRQGRAKYDIDCNDNRLGRANPLEYKALES